MKALALIEHVDRELDLVALVKLLAAREGVDLDIRHFYADAPLLLDGPAPRLVLVPFFYAAEDPVIRDYQRAWPETLFVNLGWEQLFYPSHAAIKAPRDTAARKRVTHVTWTESHAAYLRQHRVEVDNIRVTGHGVYGLFDPPYNAFFPTRAELAATHRLDANKPWMFVPENYRWAFFTDYKLRGLSKLGPARADLFENRAYCRRALAEVARWCEALAARGEVEVILRPRPATSIAEISAFFASDAGIAAPRFRIIKDRSAREWTLASDIVASSYSTVQIEAAIAGKQVARLAPEPAPAGLQYQWSDLIPAVESEAAFVAAATTDRARYESTSLATWARAQFFPAGDPVQAVTRAIVTETRRAHERSDEPKTRRVRLPAGLREEAEASPNAEARDALFRTRLRGYFFNRDTHEKDLFDSADVEARVARWRSVVG